MSKYAVVWARSESGDLDCGMLQDKYDSADDAVAAVIDEVRSNMEFCKQDYESEDVWLKAVDATVHYEDDGVIRADADCGVSTMYRIVEV